MSKNRVIRLIVALACVLLLSGAAAAVIAQESGLDRTEPEYCAVCHAPGNPMSVVVDQWEQSEHALSFDFSAGANTYCAECKSPRLADPAATHGDNDPVPVEDWEDVTCAACHPSHHDRSEWGTPIGLIDIETGLHYPVYDANELCLACHSGARHSRDFQAWGSTMFEKKGVTCVDCHMAERPYETGDGVEWAEWHEFTVEDNLPYSCGIGEDNCHHNKTAEWALKQINKAKMHRKN